MLETLLDATRRMNPKMHPSSELAVMVRDSENVAKKARWERGI